MISIYILVDPRDGRVRYVGRTSQPKQRERNHYSMQGTRHFNPARDEWIIELQRQDMHPRLVVIGRVDKRQAPYYERQAIRFYQAVGSPILNIAETGVFCGVRCEATVALGRQCRNPTIYASSRLCWRHERDKISKLRAMLRNS